MSYKATNWAWEQRLKTADKFVLVALADMADEEHSCFPSQATLARMVGASERTVRGSVARLTDLGLLTREERRRKDGRKSSDRYFLNVDGSNRQNLPVDDFTGKARPTSPAKSVDFTGRSDRYIEEEPPENHQGTISTPVVPRPDAVEEAFAAAWSKWPAPRRGTTKKAGSSFRTAVAAAGGVRQVGLILDAIDRDVAVWSTWPRSDVQFIPHLSTWLNQERWTAPPPLPRGTSSTFAQQKQTNMLDLVGRIQEEERHAQVGSRAAAGVLSIGRGA